jgi:2-polyprenyl-6-methoxyphenol hydroxylase-like FAD-dependent oxidoreductase
MPSVMGGDVPANTALSRLNLHRILIAAAERHDVKISFGTAMEQFSDNGRAVDVRFTHGRRESYDGGRAVGPGAGLRFRAWKASLYEREPS